MWNPRAQSVRFVVGFWWVFSIVVMATYSGNLIAYLTVSRIELPFDSVVAMLESREFKFGVMGGTVVEGLLQVSYLINLHEYQPLKNCRSKNVGGECSGTKCALRLTWYLKPSDCV